jgi:hypothetical protein
MSDTVNRKKKPTYIQCPHCLGHGEIPLADIYVDVLIVVRSHAEIETLDVLEKLDEKINPSALCNRLYRLMELGFVTRRRHGKCWVWKAVKA